MKAIKLRIARYVNESYKAGNHTIVISMNSFQMMSQNVFLLLVPFVPKIVLNQIISAMGTSPFQAFIFHLKPPSFKHGTSKAAHVPLIASCPMPLDNI